MTFVANTHRTNFYKKEMLFQVEVVTFDGEAEIVEVYAYNDAEAQIEAANMFDDVDYTHVVYVDFA